MSTRPRESDALNDAQSNDESPDPYTSLRSSLRLAPTRLLRSPVAGVFIALVALCIVLAIIAPNFATWNNALNVLLTCSTLAILAAGQTLALIAGELDLSIGSTEALAGAVTAVAIVTWGVPWPIGLILGIGAGALVGGTNALFTTRFGLPSFVVSLATMGIAGGGAYLLTHGTSVFGLGKQVSYLGQGTIVGIPVPIVIATSVLLGLGFVLKHTVFGLNIYAVGGNPAGAALSGVNVRRTKAAVLILCGSLAACAGIILASRLDAGSGTVGAADLMAAIGAVVIGGTSLNGGIGGLTGTALGALLIGTIQNGLVLMNVTSFWQQVAIGSLILTAALIERMSRFTKTGAAVNAR